jgi:Fe-S cluster assembly protein SufD
MPADERRFSRIDRLKIVFVDGVFDAEASDDLKRSKALRSTAWPMRAADIHWAKDVYGVLEGRGQDPVARPLAALNTAFATDGV